MAKKCRNCGFVFENGKKIRTPGANHPDAYYNPNNPPGLESTPFISEVCPKCGSDAIEEVK